MLLLEEKLNKGLIFLICYIFLFIDLAVNYIVVLCHTHAQAFLITIKIIFSNKADFLKRNLRIVLLH